MKQAVRRTVPGVVRGWYGTFRAVSRATWDRAARIVRGCLVGGSVCIVRCLPTRMQASIKERVQPVGLLDYPQSRIRMGVNSGWQQYRLRSVAKEPETVDWIEKTVGKGDVFYDIGANVGAYSLVAFAVANGAATVYAFEPGFATFNELCRNIWLNRANGSIIPIPLGLGNVNGLIQFRYSDMAPGAARHTWAGAENAPAERAGNAYQQLTPCCRIDDAVRFFGLGAPTVVKIDVDGPEYQVLLGARETFSSPGLRSILVEVDGGNDAKVRDLLRSYGFSLDQEFRRGESLCNCIYRRR